MVGDALSSTPLSSPFWNAQSGTTHEGSASLSGQSTLSANGTIIRCGISSLFCITTLTANGQNTKVASSSLSCVSTLTANAIINRNGISSLFSVCTLTADAVAVRIGNSSLSGSSTLFANGTTDFTHEGSAQLTCRSILTDGSSVTHNAVSSLFSVCVLTGAASADYVNGSASLFGRSVITVYADMPNIKNGSSLLKSTSRIVAIPTHYVRTTLTQELNWDADKCVRKNYRVVGDCQPSATNSSGGLCSPCNAENPTTTESFLLNISACSISDACKKIKNKGLNRKVKSISVFDAPFFGPNTNPNCLTDVTPEFENCVDCCDLLIHDDLSQKIKPSDRVVHVFDSSGSLSFIGEGNLQPKSYSLFASGGITFTSYSAVVSPSYAFSGSGGIIFDGSASNAMKPYYVGSGGVNFFGNTRIGFRESGSGGVAFSGGASMQLRLPQVSSGIISFSGSSSHLLPNYTFGPSGKFNFAGTASYLSSDLGELNSPIKVIETTVDQMGVFSPTAVNKFTHTLKFINLPTLCGKPIAEIITVSHNLNLLKPLANFALLNNISLPNSVNMIYRNGSTDWYYSSHYNGSSAESGAESWSISIVLTANDPWNFTVKLRRVVNGNSFMIKFSASYSPAIVCPSDFGPLNIVYDVKTGESTPVYVRKPVLVDQANYFKLSPFDKKTKLFFRMESVVQSDQLYDYDLDKQYQSTLA